MSEGDDDEDLEEDDYDEEDEEDDEYDSENVSLMIPQFVAIRTASLLLMKKLRRNTSKPSAKN